MRIVARQKGGLFSVAREVSVEDDAVRVREGGQVVSEHVLARAAADELKGFAEDVLRGGDFVEEQVGAVDGGETEVDIVSDGRACRIRLSAGESVPDQVWALLDAVERALADP